MKLLKTQAVLIANWERRAPLAAAACLLALLWRAGPARADGMAGAPRGVYVHVDFLSVLNGVLEEDGLPRLPPCGAAVPKEAAAQVHSQLQEIYRQWLGNPAIAGIKPDVDWCRVQTRNPYCPPGHRTCHFVPDHGNDWSYVDDFFDAAAATGKRVHLVITSGIYSPPWLIDELTDCADVLESSDPTSLPPCGKVTFTRYPEQRKDPDGNLLMLAMPLPWNTDYVNDWNSFLKDVAARYDGRGSRYPGLLQSVGIGGPICGSIEMILPTDKGGSYVELQSHHRIPADTVWATVIANNFGTKYASAPGQPFIDSWNRAIDDYQAIFSGITLRLNPDGGNDFPELGIAPDVDDGKVYNALLATECAQNNTDSCRAKVAVLYHFIYSSTPSSLRRVNTKGLELDGMTARTPTAFGGAGIGLQGIKFLAAYTPPRHEPPLPGPILAGAQFDFGVTNMKEKEGCPTYSPNDPKACPSLSVQQAAFNVFQAFFANTSRDAAALFDAVDNPPEYPVQYVTVASSDLTFANRHTGGVPISNGTLMSMEDIFATASYALRYLIPAR